jgi:hypothetical protein
MLFDVVIQALAFFSAITRLLLIFELSFNFFVAVFIHRSTDSRCLVSDHEELNATTRRLSQSSHALVLAVDLIVDFKEFQFSFIGKVAKAAATIVLGRHLDQNWNSLFWIVSNE